MLNAKINMPMPDNCYECPFCVWMYDVGECKLTKKHFLDNDKLFYRRPEFCTLTEDKTKKGDSK